MPIKTINILLFGIMWASNTNALDKSEFSIKKITNNISFTKVEYKTNEDIIRPLKRKLEKGKIDETEFKIETNMVPKGGIFVAEIKTNAKDPIEKAVLKKDTVEIRTCDIESSEPGLTSKFNSGSGIFSMRMVRDETKPILIFECRLRQPIPDSVTVSFITMEGKIKEEYLLFKTK